jgi:hypothetical protein
MLTVAHDMKTFSCILHLVGRWGLNCRPSIYIIRFTCRIKIVLKFRSAFSVVLLIKCGFSKLGTLDLFCFGLHSLVYEKKQQKHIVMCTEMVLTFHERSTPVESLHESCCESIDNLHMGLRRQTSGKRSRPTPMLPKEHRRNR